MSYSLKKISEITSCQTYVAYYNDICIEKAVDLNEISNIPNAIAWCRDEKIQKICAVHKKICSHCQQARI